MNRIYVDTNVFIYATSSDPQHRDRARAALKDAASQSGIATSYLTINEYVWITRRIHGFEVAIQAGKGLLETPGLQIVRIGQEETRLALELMDRYRLKPHDAGHAAATLTHKCSAILSTDPDFDAVPEIHRVVV